MYTLKVLQDLEMSDYDENDTRVFLSGHSANALTKLEVTRLQSTLGKDFTLYFEAGDEVTKSILQK